MIAYHNDSKIKSNILRVLRAHYDHDDFVKGIYWQNGKGCAVGCTIQSGRHIEYESRFGIPVALARLEDSIFEGLPNEQAKEWPLRFMNAIPVGADLSKVQWKFLHWLLTDEKVNPGINDPIVADAVAQCASLMQQYANGCMDESSAESARSAARASAAWASAESAAWSAWSARSARSAELAELAELAAWASAAWAARAVALAAESAESAEWARMADKLIELLSEAK